MDRIVHTVKSAGERATTAMRGKTRRVAAAGVLLAAAVIAIPAARGCRAPRGAAGTPPRATPKRSPRSKKRPRLQFRPSPRRRPRRSPRLRVGAGPRHGDPFCRTGA